MAINLADIRQKWKVQMSPMTLYATGTMFIIAGTIGIAFGIALIRHGMT